MRQEVRGDIGVREKRGRQRRLGVREKRGRQRRQGVRGDRGRQEEGHGRQGVMGDRGTGGQGRQVGQGRLKDHRSQGERGNRRVRRDRVHDF